MSDSYTVLAHKVANLENQIDLIKATLDKQEVADVRLEEKLIGLESQVLSVKQDVIATLNEHSRRTWGLINSGIRVICILVGIICAMAGVKLLPDILSILGGS